MVQRAKLTPQALLSAPRRSLGVPNSLATWVLHTVSTYSFETHSKTSELRAIDAQTGESHVLSKNDDISHTVWLNEDEFACLQAESDGSTSLYVASVSKTVTQPKLGESHYVAGKIDAAASNLKLAKLSEHAYAVVLSAEAHPDGKLFCAEKAPKTYSTGKLYTGLFTRHWDRYETAEKNALWYGKLSKTSSSAGKYQLSRLTNILANTGLECPIRPFGGTDHFDVSARQIIFVSKDPRLDPALNTKCCVYLAQIDSWDSGKRPVLQEVRVAGHEGAKSSPRFNHDGSKAVWLSMKTNGYEADKNHIFTLSFIPGQELTPQRAFAMTPDGTWDRSPQSVCFSADGSSLIATAEEEGAGKVFMLPLDTPYLVPRTLTAEGYMSDVKPLVNGQIFVSGSSLIDNSFYAIVDPVPCVRSGLSQTTWVNSNSGHGGKFGLKASQVSQIWTPANNPKVNKYVHSFVVRPSNFSTGRKYPVAYLIHGGPQGAWGDVWSTRWNPAVFAEQGYIVVTPNPTGSTGYGQAFTDSIRDNWGHDPYEDIVNVFEWVGKHMSEADNEHAVALGASYGGFMMNWIQGHKLGRKFKALVCHDGITTAAGMISTDELYFPLHDLGGTPWYDPGFDGCGARGPRAAQVYDNFGSSSMASWQKWDPSRHFAQWSTPQLVIHSSKDYRLPISEGLAAFNVLQARGVPSQFLTFPDENHWVIKPENSLVWHKTVLNWINQFVGLPAFAAEDTTSHEYFGGVRSEEKADAAGGAEMPTQGKIEI